MLCYKSVSHSYCTIIWNADFLRFPTTINILNEYLKGQRTCAAPRGTRTRARTVITVLFGFSCRKKVALFALRLIVSALNCWVFCLLVFDDICLFWVFCLLVFNDICPFCVGVSDIPSASMAFDGSPPTDFVPTFPSASMTFDGSPPTDLVPVPLYAMAFDGTFQLPFPPGMIPLFPPSAMPPIPTWWRMPPIIPPLPPLLPMPPPYTMPLPPVPPI